MPPEKITGIPRLFRVQDTRAALPQELLKKKLKRVCDSGYSTSVPQSRASVAAIYIVDKYTLRGIYGGIIGMLRVQSPGIPADEQISPGARTADFYARIF